MENKNVNNVEEGAIVVDGGVFDSMMQASVALFNEIIEKGQKGEFVTDAEGNWANTFIEYADALELVEVKNNGSDE